MDSKDNVQTSTGRATDDREWRPDPEHVAFLAYCYYEERGRQHGEHEHDWYRAEDELRRRYEAESRSRSSEANEPVRTVIGVFRNVDDAQRGFDQLIGEGFSRDDISFVANKAVASEWTEPATNAAGEAAEHASEPPLTTVAEDAGIGAAIGGVGGLLLSFAGLAIPGVGPVLASGPIVAALGGAGLGAAAGGLVGVLTENGVPKEEAGHYAEGVRRGGILITVKASGDRADRAARILNDSGAIDIDDRVADWRKRGWRGYDSKAEPLTDDEARREREYFIAANRQAQEWARKAGARGSRRQRSVAVQPRPAARVYSPR